MHIPQAGAKAIKNKIQLIVIITLSVLCFINADARRPKPPLLGEGINPPSEWNSGDGKAFVVATYNIRRSKGNDGVRDISRSAGVLERAGADIIGLNEVSGNLRYGLNNQVEQIGQLLDLGWLFAPSASRWHQDHTGNGLLSGFPVTRWEIQPLYAGVKENRSLRNMIIATISIQGTPVNFLITHLDRGPIREEQLTQVLDRFKELPGPSVILGDFNSRNKNKQLTRLLKNPKYKDAVRLGLGKQIARVNWIISKGLKINSAGMQERGISDHPGFWVSFSLHG